MCADDLSPIAQAGKTCADELSLIAQAWETCADELPPIAHPGKTQSWYEQAIRSRKLRKTATAPIYPQGIYSWLRLELSIRTRRRRRRCPFARRKGPPALPEGWKAFEVPPLTPAQWTARAPQRVFGLGFRLGTESFPRRRRAVCCSYMINRLAVLPGTAHRPNPFGDGMSQMTASLVSCWWAQREKAHSTLLDRRTREESLTHIHISCSGIMKYEKLKWH